jgi:hypothetical protein
MLEMFVHFCDVVFGFVDQKLLFRMVEIRAFVGVLLFELAESGFFLLDELLVQP